MSKSNEQSHLVKILNFIKNLFYYSVRLLTSSNLRLMTMMETPVRALIRHGQPT
jgi:hypothetical protein